eukprot:6173030-Pleurochrysis_carterae.AAC.1
MYMSSNLLEPVNTIVPQYRKQPHGLWQARYEEYRRVLRPSWPSIHSARARSVGECVRVRSE